MNTTDADEQKARTTQAFTQTAAGYDQSGPRYFSHFGRQLVLDAGIRPGSRVLDVATGRGAVLFPAAEAVGSGGSIIGIDLTEAMVKATARDVNERGLRNVEVRVMDAEDLRFPDASFDAVLCGFGIAFFPHLNRALAGFRRVLAPGGVCGVSNFLTLPSSSIAEVRRRYLPQSSSVAQQQFLATNLHDVLHSAGWNTIQLHRHTLDTVYSDNEAYWSMFNSLVTRVQLKALPRETQERFRSDVFARLDDLRQADGIHEQLEALFAIAR